MTSQFAHCRTLSDFKTVPNSRRNPRRPHLPSLDTAFLTFYDYERIKKNAFIPSREESLNNERIQKEQKDTQLAKARALKDKIQKYDKNKPKYFLSEIEREKIINDRNLLLKAQKYRDDNEDVVKEMEKLAFYAKVATIRDKQKQEHIIMEQNHKRKEEKLDMMMELERLKELKNQQDKERMMQKQRKEGCMIIIEQMKKKKLEQIKLKEQLDKEKKDILKYLKKLEDEEQIENEKKKILREKISQEIVESNRISALNKQKKLAQEKEEDLKILKYNMEKAKREEEELKRKKKIQEQKEKEVQKLREKQEKAQDKMAELDALRAKRAQEAGEREARLKEKNELITKKKIMEELLDSNNRQKIQKQNQLAEQARQEQAEYERIIKKQLDDMERERKIEEEKKRMRYENNQDIRKLIKLKEEKDRLEAKEILEEGRKDRQKYDTWKERMERIKQQKIQELKDLNVHPIYIADLERYKIV
jgi:hypothetical protein